MPGSSPSALLESLVTHDYPIAEEHWGDFWDRLRGRELSDGESLAVVSSLTSHLPDATSITGMLRSLRARNPAPQPLDRTTVNIVGTGGGPSTFNLSTASAFVAATAGARVIKTGSRAYASRTGSIDLLERLGVPLTSTWEQTQAMLDTFNIACAGPFVYPKELRLLARSILPFGMKTVGRFFNVVGPFLAAVPVSMQITGVSDHSLLPTFRELAAQDTTKRLWLCANELGADELLSIVDSEVFDSERGETFVVSPRELGLGEGSFDDLLPVPELDATVEHFLSLVGGNGPAGALQSIQLNAGALVLNAELAGDWSGALELAGEALHSGETTRLIERIREHAPRAPAAARPGSTTSD
jgi:anthranilate phosphoribosyltransferase